MEEGGYIRESELGSREKRETWAVAMGLQAVDGLEPTPYLKEQSAKHIKGEVTLGEVEQLVKSYYEAKDRRLATRDEEADKVSVNITKVLSEHAFSFSVPGFLSIHRRLFDGVFETAGQVRTYNITKKEWVLGGDTILYAPASELYTTLEYDLEKEWQFDYSKLLSKKEVVAHLAEFIAGLWQIHPFAEGNTRTTAVFAIQYLRTLGLVVENTLFEKESWYFRNALVRANYQNITKGIVREPKFLIYFLENLLMGTAHPLSNRQLVIHDIVQEAERTPGKGWQGRANDDEDKAPHQSRGLKM